MDANSLLFSISSAMAGRSQSLGSQSQTAGLGLIEGGLTWQGLSLTDKVTAGDFSTVLKEMIMAKIKGTADSGTELEKVLIKITEKGDTDTQASGQELLSSILAALLPQLTSQPDLMLKLKASGSGVSDGSSEEALLKQKITELLANIKEGTQAADILSQITKEAAGSTSVDKSAQTGTWRDTLAQMLMVHLKSSDAVKNAVVKVIAKAQEVQGQEVVQTSDPGTSQTNSDATAKTTAEGASLYDKLLSLSQAAFGAKKSPEAFHTAQAYGLQSEGMLSKAKSEAAPAKSDVDLDSTYMTLPKSENLVKELSFAFGSGKKGLDKDAQDFSALGSGGLFVKNLEGSLDDQALQVAKAQVAESVRAQEVVDQVVQKISTSIKEGVQEALVELKPEHLGKALMKVSLDNGKLSVRFEVSSHAVKETLESNFSMLKDSLKDKGYSMEQFSVSVNTNAHGNGNEPRQQFVQPQAHGMGWLDDSESEMEAAGVSATGQAVSVPNYYVEQALVNYLI